MITVYYLKARVTLPVTSARLREVSHFARLIFRSIENMFFFLIGKTFMNVIFINYDYFFYFVIITW